MIPGSLHHLLDRPEFRTGAALGGALTALGLATCLVAMEHRRRALPIGGLLIAAGFVAGACHSAHLPNAIAPALGLLAAGGFAAGVIVRKRAGLWPLGIALASPGAVLLARHLQVASAHAHPRPPWIAMLVVGSVAIGGPLVANFDRRFAARGWPMVLYAVSVAGMYATVPDTERALVLLGVSVPLLFLGWPFPLVSLGSAGSYAAVGALVWVGTTDGRGRETAIIGAIACLGLLVIEPVARLVRGRATVLAALPASGWTVVTAVVAHLAIVYVASRVAGLKHTVSTAATIVAISSAIVAAVLCWCEAPPGAGPETWEEAD